MLGIPFRSENAPVSSHSLSPLAVSLAPIARQTHWHREGGYFVTVQVPIVLSPGWGGCMWWGGGGGGIIGMTVFITKGLLSKRFHHSNWFQ